MCAPSSRCRRRRVSRDDCASRSFGSGRVVEGVGYANDGERGASVFATREWERRRSAMSATRAGTVESMALARVGRILCRAKEQTKNMEER